MKTSLIPLAVFLVMSSFALADDADEPKDQPAMFRIATRKKDDAVEIQVNKDKTVFVVKSPSGIGQAVIERASETWPDAVVLRFHLNGMKSFRATNCNVTLDTTVSSQDGKVRMWKDGKEDTPLDEKSPFRTAIRIVGGDGKVAKEIPLNDGYFEVALPRAFFEANPKSITVNWIDFYRN